MSASIEILTKLVADCHALTPVPGLRHWQPSFNSRQVLSRLERGSQAGVPGEVIRKLTSAWEVVLQDLTSHWRSAAGQASVGVLHGDPQPNNTGRRAGRWQLIDCDSVCAGPPEYDLAQVIISSCDASRDNIRRVVSAYGREPDLEMLSLMIRARAIKRCTWLAGLWDKRPDLQPRLLKLASGLDDTDFILAHLGTT